MEGKPKISVIIPVFNAEKYLEHCLDSLVSQTLKEIEIIVINDGSTDASWKIIQDYASRDSRVIPVNQLNLGVALSRKKGVCQAKGEYIGFVDSDDWVDVTMFERLYDVAKSHDADAVECNKHGEPSTSQDGVFSQTEFRERIAKPHLLCGVGASVLWSRIYRNSALLQEIDYGNQQTFEDYLFNLQFFVYVQRYVKMQEGLYHYRLVPGSLSKQYKVKTFEDLKYSHEVKLHLLPEYGWISETDLLADAHWFIQNTLNIVNVLICSTCAQCFKFKETKRMLMDSEVKSAVLLLKQAQQLGLRERWVLFPTWFAMRVLVITQSIIMVKRWFAYFNQSRKLVHPRVL